MSMQSFVTRGLLVLASAAALGGCELFTGSDDELAEARFTAESRGDYYDLDLSGEAQVVQRDGAWFIELSDRTISLPNPPEPVTESVLLLARGGVAPLQPGTYPVVPGFGSNPAVVAAGWTLFNPAQWAILTPTSGTVRIEEVTQTSVRGDFDMVMVQQFNPNRPAPVDTVRMSGRFNARFVSQLP